MRPRTRVQAQTTCVRTTRAHPARVDRRVHLLLRHRRLGPRLTPEPGQRANRLHTAALFALAVGTCVVALDVAGRCGVRRTRPRRRSCDTARLGSARASARRARGAHVARRRAWRACQALVGRGRAPRVKLVAVLADRAVDAARVGWAVLRVVLPVAAHRDEERHRQRRNAERRQQRRRERRRLVVKHKCKLVERRISDVGYATCVMVCVSERGWRAMTAMQPPRTAGT